jgi:hypothetical protein
MINTSIHRYMSWFRTIGLVLSQRSLNGRQQITRPFVCFDSVTTKWPLNLPQMGYRIISRSRRVHQVIDRLIYRLHDAVKCWRRRHSKAYLGFDGPSDHETWTCHINAIWWGFRQRSLAELQSRFQYVLMSHSGGDQNAGLCWSTAARCLATEVFLFPKGHSSVKSASFGDFWLILPDRSRPREPYPTPGH